jgi:UDP-N-acetylmuramoylalanine--D-glutamate ligase
VVLLSPGGTSFDEFKDFAERGERFRKWVQELS